jgi:hypothetical protein
LATHIVFPTWTVCNEHLDDEEGPLVFHHACKLGLEGIVSKRCDSPYSSGRSRHWICRWLSGARDTTPLARIRQRPFVGLAER